MSELPAGVIEILVSNPETVDADAVGAAFEDLLRRGRAAWPDQTPSPTAVARVCRHLLADAVDPAAHLRACDAAEIWLAAGCQEQLGPSIRALDEHYVARLDAALASTRIDAGAVAEVKQRVRHKLLGTDEDGVMRLAKYCGRGRLSAMARVIAIRSAVDLRRVEARHPERAVNGDTLAVERLVDGGLGPELAAVTDEQRAVLKGAFERAVADLSSDDRGVLRLHLVERLAIDDIAALHSVHRATAARWLTRIRTTLGEGTRAGLRDRIGRPDTDLASWLDLMTDRVDLSLSRVLAAGDDG